MLAHDLVGDTPIGMLTVPAWKYSVEDPDTPFLHTSSSTPAKKLIGHSIVYYSPQSLEYEPLGEPKREPLHQGKIYYIARISSVSGPSCFNSKGIMEPVFAKARSRSVKDAKARTFTSAKHWSRSYVVVCAAHFVEPMPPHQLDTLRRNWAYLMGAQPLLLEGKNREAILALKVNKVALPPLEEVPAVARDPLRTARRHEGCFVESVERLYAIRHPLQSGLLKVECEIVREAKQPTAGEAKLEIEKLDFSAGLGREAEKFVQDELKHRGRHESGEWFSASDEEIKGLFIKAHTHVTSQD